MSKELTRVYVQTDEALVSLCTQLAQSSILAVDTEFVRTRTLYPKLGLLQVNNGDVLALIDPITINDLSPFWAVMSDPNVCKVLHACSEDLEVFLTVGKCKPENLIDSQIIMSFLGHGLSMGYAAMVKHYTEIELDKSESRTDWTKRPLTQKQLTYAEADVEHLFAIYPKLLADIEAKGWLSCAQAESQNMIERKFTPLDLDSLYRNVKLSWKLSSQQLNNLKYLTIWRYQQAQKRNMPIGFIAKDHTLFALAYRMPTSIGEMQMLEGVELLDVKHKGHAMLEVLQKAQLIPESEYPNKITRLDEYPGYKEAYKKVKAFLVKIAESSGITPENIASKKQINHFLSWNFHINDAEKSPESVDLLNSWRGDLLSEKLKAFAANKFT